VRIDAVYFDNENITMIACALHCTAAVSETGKMWMFCNTNRMSGLAWSVSPLFLARLRFCVHYCIDRDAVKKKKPRFARFSDAVRKKTKPRFAQFFDWTVYQNN